MKISVSALSPSCISAHQCFLFVSALLALPLSVGVCTCVSVFCLPGCWTNSREIILPQSPSLSGQSDEELVIFNTAGGLFKYQRGQTPCLRVQKPISLLPLFPPSVYSFSQWDHSKWLGRDRGICSADSAHRRHVEINWTGPIMDRYKATEETMQTQLGLRIDQRECWREDRW